MPAKKKKVVSLRCPTCRKIVLKDDPDFPFCSDRCRLIDLGRWASGEYKISSPVLDPEEIEDAEHREANRRRIEETEFEVDEYQRRRPN
jgi:endogenous inhibitor of DNA gyrase (YacG/DUF329 family)